MHAIEPHQWMLEFDPYAGLVIVHANVAEKLRVEQALFIWRQTMRNLTKITDAYTSKLVRAAAVCVSAEFDIRMSYKMHPAAKAPILLEKMVKRDIYAETNKHKQNLSTT